MPLRVSGKNMDVGDALRERVTARVGEAFAKYFDGGYSGHMTIERDGSGFRTECALHLDSGFILQAEAGASDAYASADQTVQRIEKRLRRYKHRLKDRQASRRRAASENVVDAPSYVIEAPSADDEEAAGFNPVIIAESTTTLRQLSVSDAVVELDLSGVPFLVFRHAGHGGMNLVYRRPDGHIGWIDPPAPKPPNGH